MATVAGRGPGHDVTFPDVQQIDIAKVQVFYDVDLDELTVLYNGTARRHAFHEIDTNVYALVGSNADDVVGFELHQFMKKIVPLHPGFRLAIAVATILSDEADVSETPTESSGKKPGATSKQGEPGSEQIRAVLDSFATLQLAI